MRVTAYNSEQAAPDDTTTYMEWDAEDFNTASMWAIGDPSEIVIPEDGHYLIEAGWRLGRLAPDEWFVSIAVNRTDFYDVQSQPGASTDDAYRWLGSGSMVLELSAADVVELSIYQNSGSAEAVDGSNSSPWMSVVKLEGAQGATGPTGPVAPPTLPTVASVGSAFGSTGVPTATLPAGQQADDILLLILQQSNEANVTVAGYQQIGPQNGIGAAASSGSTKMSLFWKRSTGGGESAPTIPDTGDHTYGVMLAIRGCPTTGDPFHFASNEWNFTAGTAFTGPTFTTTIDNCLMMDVVAHAVDSASAQFSAWTCASLSNITEQFDGGTTDGTGGGIAVTTGEKATAGDVAAMTATIANSTVYVSSRIAWIPANVTAVASSPRPIEQQIFLGSPANLDDLWVKPTGARSVLAQICDGGSSGSGGNTTTTAAGGGGGGGGGYDEAWFLAQDLAASLTVHAGRGGAAGTGLNQGGSAGVVSEFGKGGNGPLTSGRRIAGTAATAAASADGGNGGCGSGRGRASLAVVTTRVSIDGTGAGRAGNGQGAAGGSGTTAPVGGSTADWGGGGGESGGDSDAALTSANNGWSIRGGGGGSGGRTNTNASVAGFGGGAAAPSTQGAAGNDSATLPFGGSGGNGGGSSVATGGTRGFPGGGGGGGGGVTGGFGGAGGHGCVVVTTHF